MDKKVLRNQVLRVEFVTANLFCFFQVQPSRDAPIQSTYTCGASADVTADSTYRLHLSTHSGQVLVEC